MSQVRGKINNPARAKQLHDFTGLRFKNITPTDIDGFVEFKDTLFVLMEAKFNGAELPHGQRLAIERLCKSLQKAGKIAAALILIHNTYVDEEIDFAGCVVSEYWYNGEWRTPKKGILCRAAIEEFLKIAGLDYS